MKKQTRKRESGERICRVLLALFAILYTMPLLVTFTNSLMSSAEVNNAYLAGTSGRGAYVDMHLLPNKVTLSQYGRLLLDTPSIC